MVMCLVERRGLGPVLTMAFIIVGVMIGVVLLLIFAQKSINRGQDIIDPDCFTVDLKLEKCEVYGQCSYFSGTGYYDADIFLKRGVGRANLTGLRFSFEDVFGRKGVYDFNLTSVQLEELQSLSFQEPSPPWPARIPVVSAAPYLVRAIALIGDKKDVCPIASQPVICGIEQSPPEIGALPNSPTNYCCQCAPFMNYSSCYPGNDTNYPIESDTTSLNYGLVLNGLGEPPLENGIPPGYNSVCCLRTPQSLIGTALPGYFYGSSNSNLQEYWDLNYGEYGTECPSYTGQPLISGEVPT